MRTLVLCSNALEVFSWHMKVNVCIVIWSENFENLYLAVLVGFT